MNCREIRNRIDLELSSGFVDINSELRSHLEQCEKCEAYLDEVRHLQGILNSQKFEALPGELDDINFENIINAKPSIKEVSTKTGFWHNLRWVWVPAAAAAVIAMFLFSPQRGNFKSGGSAVTRADSVYVGDNVFVKSDQEGTDLIKSLVSDDSQIDQLADELIFGSEIDDLVETLTDDEFELLYNKMTKLNGSS